MRPFLKAMMVGSAPVVLLAACGKNEATEAAKAPAGPAVSQPATAPATTAATIPATQPPLEGAVFGNRM